MLIQEVIRSCANERVAEAAVISIGRAFASRVHEQAVLYDMSVGAFVSLSIKRFAKHGDEGEMRSVIQAMRTAQEPVLAGLHRILCIMLASGAPSADARTRERAPRIAAQLCAMEAEIHRGYYG